MGDDKNGAQRLPPLTVAKQPWPSVVHNAYYAPTLCAALPAGPLQSVTKMALGDWHPCAVGRHCHQSLLASITRTVTGWQASSYERAGANILVFDEGVAGQKFRPAHHWPTVGSISQNLPSHTIRCGAALNGTCYAAFFNLLSLAAPRTLAASTIATFAPLSVYPPL